MNSFLEYLIDNKIITKEDLYQNPSDIIIKTENELKRVKNYIRKTIKLLASDFYNVFKYDDKMKIYDELYLLIIGDFYYHFNTPYPDFIEYRLIPSLVSEYAHKINQRNKFFRGGE